MYLCNALNFVAAACSIYYTVAKLLTTTFVLNFGVNLASYLLFWQQDLRLADKTIHHNTHGSYNSSGSSCTCSKSVFLLSGALGSASQL